MKIYTGKGDKGYTGLINNHGTHKKSQLIFDVLGTIDELSASLGFIHRSNIKSLVPKIFELQNLLFTLGSVIADESKESYDQTFWLMQVKELEKSIDNYQDELPEITGFILPGGSLESSSLHLSRTICRRLERRLVDFVYASQEDDFQDLISFVNRLSDFLFVMARFSNHILGEKDVLAQSVDY